MISVNDMEDTLKRLLERSTCNISQEFYSKNHVKLLSGSEKEMISSHIHQLRLIENEPFLLTNIGDVFIYSKEYQSIFLYYSRLDEMDLVLNFVEDDLGFDWFINVFLEDSSVLSDVFNQDLLDIPLKQNEILYCPPFLNDEETNYRPMEVDLAFHFFNENY